MADFSAKEKNFRTVPGTRDPWIFETLGTSETISKTTLAKLIGIKIHCQSKKYALIIGIFYSIQYTDQTNSLKTVFL